MQPVSFGRYPSNYSVSPISSGTERMPRYEREAVENDAVSNNRMLANRRRKKFTDMTNAELMQMAQVDASRDNKYKARTYLTTMAAIPLLDTFSHGVHSGPHLSGRLGAMGKTAATWGGILALAGLYNGVTNKVEKSVPAFSKFEEKYPVVTALMKIAGFVGVYLATAKGVSKLTKTVTEHMPGVVNDLTKIKAKLANKINNSALNNKIAAPINEKFAKLAEKYPQTMTSLGVAIACAAPFLLGGLLFKAITDRNEEKAKIKDNYNQLVQARTIGNFVEKVQANIQKAQPVNVSALAAANAKLKPETLSTEPDELDTIAEIGSEHLDTIV